MSRVYSKGDTIKFQDSGKIGLVLRAPLLHKEFVIKYNGQQINEVCPSGCCCRIITLPNMLDKIWGINYEDAKFVWYSVLVGDNKGWVAFDVIEKSKDDNNRLHCNVWQLEERYNEIQ